jgi:Cys-rich repeat protein
LLALACGGDDDGNNDTNGDGDNQQPTGVVLGKGVVGKECTADTDCGSGGKCNKTQSLGSLDQVLSAIGVDTSLPAPGGYCTVPCTNDANCGEGGVCFGAIGALFQGECRKGCKANTDCRPGYECAQMATAPDGGTIGGALGRLPSQCQALPPTQTLGPNQAGAACNDNPDAGTALNHACDPGACALGACTATCVNDSTCGAGAACIPNGIYGTTGSCQETCAVDTDCNQFARGDVGCIDVNGRKLCGPKLFPLAPGVLGKACTEDTDCGKGSCAQTLGGGFTPPAAPGGYCTLNGCQDDSVCTGGACISNGFAGNRCYDGCTVDSECREGYSCQERTSATMVATKVCAPATAPRDAGTATTTRVGGLDAGI